jgi:hypothetical protein
MQDVRHAIKDFKTSSLFFVIESTDDIEKKSKLVQRRCYCQPANVIRANGDKRPIYNGLYNILEKSLANFLTDIETKVMTRQVSFYKAQLDILKRKLDSRKLRTTSKLTEGCIRKIKQ